MLGEQRTENAYKLFHELFVFYAIISLLEGILVFFSIVSIPSDPKNELILGFSSRRLILLAMVLGGLIILAAALVAFIHKKVVKEFIFQWMNKTVAGRVSSYFGLLMAIFVLVPVLEWGRWGAVFERALPLIIWLCLLFWQYSCVVWIASGKFVLEVKDWATHKINKSRRTILFSMGVLITCYFLSILIYPSSMNEDYWYETGVPILLWQIISALALGLIYIKFEKKIQKRLGRKIDATIFLLIFLSCGLLWAFSPLTPSHFNPKPLPPNNIYYPNSDAQIFDLQAQSTLVGLGFDNGTPLDRPFYPLFLAIIHLISGQDYSANMMLQAFLYGIFPAIVYLLCSEMGSRRWGVVTSIAIGFWGYNAILLNNVLNTSTPKQMLSDFPMTIVLSLVLYFSIRWQKGGAHAGVNAFITGGMIALSTYVRYSALVLLPLWIIVTMVTRRQEFKKGLILTALFISGFLVVTMPWYTRNILIDKNMYIPFTQKFSFIIEERYPSNEKIPDTEDFRSDDVLEEYEVKSPVGNDLTKPFFNWFTPHLVHNIMSSILILPSSLEIISLDTSLDNGGGIWNQFWDGKLPIANFLFVLLQIFILTVGLVSLFQRKKTMATIIILLFFGLHLANSLGRTSGGRFIIPVNWIVLLVYFAGIIFLTSKLSFFQEGNLENRARKVQASWKAWMITIFSLIIIGALPVIYERISFIVFQTQAEIKSFEELFNLPASNISIQELLEKDQFLDQRKTRIIQGFAFYPTQQLTTASKKSSDLLNYDGQLSLLNFHLLQPGKREPLNTVFPYGEMIDIQNQDKVLLVGCKIKDEFIVRYLVIIRQDSAAYYQSDYVFNECDLDN